MLKFPKSEMLAGDCTKATSVLCFLCRRRQKICTSQIASNAPSSPRFWFFNGKTLDSNDQNRVADQWFSLKQWFAGGAQSRGLRKSG